MVSRYSSPFYTYQTSSGYIFRLRIPEDLKDTIGNSEFRYSLRTGALRTAKHRANCIVALVHQLFKEVRNNLHRFTSEKINPLVKRYIKEAIEHDEYYQRSLQDPCGLDQSKQPTMVSEIDEYKAMNRELLNAMKSVLNGDMRASIWEALFHWKRRLST